MAGAERMSVGGESAQKGGAVWETVRVIVHALIIALIVRVFFFQPFNIPSGSMKSTLLVGDYLFVSKMSYGYSRYSLPGGYNLFEGRIFSSTPNRGDVVVFKLPRDPATDFIKRVVGLPGDEIQVRDGVLYINGQAVPKKFVGEWESEDEYGRVSRYRRFEETLPTNDMKPGGVKHFTLDKEADSQFDNTSVYKVPEGHYFMMGDNRDESNDSRARSSVGFIPHDHLVGRAQIIWFSGDEQWGFLKFWTWPAHIRWSRFFSLVR
jgi:signal peptidase I